MRGHMYLSLYIIRYLHICVSLGYGISMCDFNSVIISQYLNYRNIGLISMIYLCTPWMQHVTEIWNLYTLWVFTESQSPTKTGCVILRGFVRLIDRQLISDNVLRACMLYMVSVFTSWFHEHAMLTLRTNVQMEQLVGWMNSHQEDWPSSL